jgi:prepilin peptidase CpaA
MNNWAFMSVSLLLVCACWTDLRHMQIPNTLTVSFAGGGLLYQVAAHGIQGLGWAVAGAITGILPLYFMNRLGGIGGGDVKWFGAFGIWMGPLPTLQLIIFSVLFAGGIAGVLLTFRLPGLRSLGRRFNWPWGPHPLIAGKGAQFPFMLAVAPGFIMLMGKG